MANFAAWSGLIASGWLVIFQVLLAAGAPLGFLAWGGQDPGKLPRTKRMASAFSAIVILFFAAAFGQAAGLWDPFGSVVLRWAFLAGILLFALSTLGNIATSSIPERWLGVPVAGILTLACVILGFF